MELLSKDLRKVKLSLKKLEKDGKLLEVAQSMGLRTEGDLYAGIGYGKVSSTKVLAQVLPEDTNIEEKLRKPESALDRIFQRAAQVSRQKVGVSVSGFDDILVRFAKCCQPLPGDRIVGFITRGRGVTVHYAECPQALESDPLRQVQVNWDVSVKAPRRIRLTVHSQDQMGLLANVSRAITDCGANINNAQIKTTESGKAVNSFEITVSDAKQLDKVKRQIEMVPGVIKVERIKQLPAQKETHAEE
jgi:GTP pyrophosphokinase